VSEVDETLDALFATLQRVEYRTPYTPPLRWPLYDDPNAEWIEVTMLCDPEPMYVRGRR
jgi:hypothetical protein